MTHADHVIQPQNLDVVAESLGTRDLITPDAFRGIFRNHAASACIITADDDSGPVALTATSVISISSEPPMIAFSLSAQSSSTPTIARAETLVIHFLGSTQLHLAKLCATSGIDRFADRSLWSRLPTGEPKFHDTRAWMRGKIVDRMVAGNSTVVAVHILQSDVAADAREQRPLVYVDSTWHGLSPESVLADSRQSAASGK